MSGESHLPDISQAAMDELQRRVHELADEHHMQPSEVVQKVYDALSMSPDWTWFFEGMDE